MNGREVVGPYQKLVRPVAPWAGGQRLYVQGRLAVLLLVLRGEVVEDDRVPLQGLFELDRVDEAYRVALPARQVRGDVELLQVLYPYFRRLTLLSKYFVLLRIF
jgi:hypothetical protein